MVLSLLNILWNQSLVFVWEFIYETYGLLNYSLCGHEVLILHYDQYSGVEKGFEVTRSDVHCSNLIMR